MNNIIATILFWLLKQTTRLHFIWRERNLVMIILPLLSLVLLSMTVSKKKMELGTLYPDGILGLSRVKIKPDPPDPDPCEAPELPPYQPPPPIQWLIDIVPLPPNPNEPDFPSSVDFPGDVCVAPDVVPESRTAPFPPVSPPPYPPNCPGLPFVPPSACHNNSGVKIIRF